MVNKFWNFEKNFVKKYHSKYNQLGIKMKNLGKTNLLVYTKKIGRSIGSIGEKFLKVNKGPNWTLLLKLDIMNDFTTLFYIT